MPPWTRNIILNDDIVVARAAAETTVNSPPNLLYTSVLYVPANENSQYIRASFYVISRLRFHT